MKSVLRKTLLSCLSLLLLTKVQASLELGYTNKLSYREGEVVTFYTKTTQSSGSAAHNLYDINGSVATTITLSHSHQTGRNNLEPWKNGYGFSSTGTWTVPSGFKSGVYYLDADSIDIYVIIKGDKASTIAVVCPTNTDMAYSGDPSYDQNGLSYINMYGQTSSLIYAPVVSYRRPLIHQGHSDGFLRWADTRFTDSLNVICDQDMDDYTEIEQASLLIVVGHSEYWSREARKSFDRFVDEGKDVLILSGNTMWWQVRYEDPGSNPQMICYRGAYSGYPYTDPICDPLLETSSWDKTELNYSILGSMGSDWPHGGFGHNDPPRSYVGFDGFKIVQSSPVLSTTSPSLTISDVLSLYPVSGSEMDGTLVYCDALGEAIPDGNGYPVANAPALGMLRAELIGYDLTNGWVQNAGGSSRTHYYSGMMAMQRTNASGRVINVNHNFWCMPSHFALTNVQTVTDKMISLLLGGSNIFVSSAPGEFVLTPANSHAVSYNACNSGSVTITPGGVVLQNAFRVDQKDGDPFATIINCSTCNSGAMIRPPVPFTPIVQNPGLLEVSKGFNGWDKNVVEKTVHVSKDNKPAEMISLFPNPNSGTFEVKAPKGSYSILNAIGQLVSQFNVVTDQHFSITISGMQEGIYFIVPDDKGQKISMKFSVQHP